MRTKTKVAAIAIAVALPAFLLSPVLFPPAEGGPVPTSSQRWLTCSSWAPRMRRCWALGWLS